MVGTTLGWEDELGRWLKPFLDCLGHKARRRMCPLYNIRADRPRRSQERAADGEAGRTIGCDWRERVFQSIIAQHGPSQRSPWRRLIG